MKMQVFVYGTLKRGQCNNVRLGGATFVRETTVPAVMRVPRSNCYPGIEVPEENNLEPGSATFETSAIVESNHAAPDDPATLDGLSFVEGEVYEVTTQEQLDGLDRLEGYRGPGESNFYERVLVRDMSGRPVWIYTLDRGEAFGPITGEPGETVSFDGRHPHDDEDDEDDYDYDYDEDDDEDEFYED